jgi:hypothetical protein
VYFLIEDVVISNFDNYHMNSSIHRIDTRYRNQLYGPVTKLSCFQKGVFYTRIKISNSFPSAILGCENNKSQFKASLSRFLVANSFYSHAEFFPHSQN